MQAKLKWLLLALCVSVSAWAETRGTIKGIVLDSEGKPVAKAKVLASEMKFTVHRLLQFHETDSEGQFVVDSLPWGTYFVSAGKEDEGYPELAGGLYGTDQFPVVKLQPSSPSASVTIHLLPKSGAIGPVSVVDALTGMVQDSASITLRRVADPKDFILTSTTVKSILVPSNVDVAIEIAAEGYRPWPAKGESKGEGQIRLKPEQALKLDVKLAPEGSTASSVGIFRPAVYAPGANIARPAPQPGNPVLSQALQPFRFTAENISDPLKELARRYHVPIGFEVEPSGSRSKKPKSVRIDVETGTVRDALNAIIEADPVYTWEESTFGAINVFPKDHLPSLLDVVVSNYSATNVWPEEALKELLKTPEAQHWMDQAGATYQGATGAVPQPSRDSSLIYSITMKDAPVRSILNAILTSRVAHLWMYYRYGDRNQFFALSVVD